MAQNNPRRKAVFIILLFFSFLLIVKANSIGREKQITVIFRYDDCSSRSLTAIEAKLINAFQERNISCTFGVTPYVCVGDWLDARAQGVLPLTSQKIIMLRDAEKRGVLEVALHGYSHQAVGDKKYGRVSEFVGRDYNSQLERLANGKEYLEKTIGVTVTAFIPPWNSYDSITLKALEKLEFKVISADRYGGADKFSLLKFVPQTCNIFNLQEAVRSARRIPDTSPVVVVMLHQGDIVKNGGAKEELTSYFIDLLDWVVSQKDIRVQTIDAAAKVIEDLSARRFMDVSFYFRLAKLVPPPLLEILQPQGVYLFSNVTTAYNSSLKTRLWVFIFLFYLSILITTIVGARYLGEIVFVRLKMMGLVIKYGSPILLILSLVYAFYNLEVSYKGAIVITLLLGSYLGSRRAFLRFEK